ncbi:cobyrinate a,c-diamide synthase [Thermosulfurimonas dismutans]|uniref:Cobyrinate a,c-diamide synthase n=1 Tax=Thermosulfurimonas dismutans TaxID=999894 RepID=A0A179D6A5_9BACT|nr:cobyrinate a,c-diamide synthase [Thermosulfurimonas dismutans]OAQ21321.1 Cobyrinic acid A,C-diamide synthase [Thermosulfurimonas dismutans]
MSYSFQIPRVVIAAQKGGAGKTFFTLGLLTALRKRGFKVVSFKKGPDYIDAGWLYRASGYPCRNLDPFLMDDETILALFSRGVQGSEVAIIEGNRGLYDGVDLEGSCSTARLARLLKAPIVLVLDCTKVTRTMAALLKGFLEFEEGVEIKGVILNRVARARHENIITRSIEYYTGIPVLGVLPRIKVLFPERHLGLVPWQEFTLEESLFSKLEEIFRKNVDVSRIIDLAHQVPPLEVSPKEIFISSHELEGVRIGVLRDKAFQFYYPENLEALSALGAELVFLDALKESRLPDIQALYIGGGFPETQAEALSENRSFMKDLKEAVEDGLPVYAECGGLMYLGEKIIWKGKTFPMTGVLPIDFEVKERPQGHGYTVVRVDEQNPFYPTGTVLQGHEFHYSLPIVKDDSRLKFCFKVERGFGFDGRRDGVLYKRALGTYTHVHVASTPAWLAGMCRVLSEKDWQDTKSLGKDLSASGGVIKSDVKI